MGGDGGGGGGGGGKWDTVLRILSFVDGESSSRSLWRRGVPLC